MGTRADFYVGVGKPAEWLGSIAWDGYPDGIDEAVLAAKNPEEFRAAVNHFLSDRRDATLPNQGWPWPWDDSHTTDYAYRFVDGKVESLCFGQLIIGADEDGDAIYSEESQEFPNMAAVKNITLGERSGVIIFTA